MTQRSYEGNVEQHQKERCPFMSSWNRTTVKPVTKDQPLGPEKAVFSGRWSLVTGLHRTATYECETGRAWQKWSVVAGWSLVTVVFSYRFYCSSRLVASHGGL